MGDKGASVARHYTVQILKIFVSAAAKENNASIGRVWGQSGVWGWEHVGVTNHLLILLLAN